MKIVVHENKIVFFGKAREIVQELKRHAQDDVLVHDLIRVKNNVVLRHGRPTQVN